MKSYLTATIKIAGEDTETFAGYLWTLEPEGIEHDDDQIQMFFDDISSETNTKVENALQQYVQSGIIAKFSVEFKIEEVKNWNEEWEKSIQTIRVTDKTVINPSFRQYEPKAGEIVIAIDPKMSFGTGEHETTKMMVTLLEELVTPEMETLDVGSGTGVLAIASVLFGAKYSLGVDNDEWCLLNGNENIALNNLQGRVEVIMGELKDVPQKNGYDIVIANIQKNILMSIKELLFAQTKSGGIILLSGLLSTDESDIVTAFEALGLSFKTKLQMNEWIAVAFDKK